MTTLVTGSPQKGLDQLRQAEPLADITAPVDLAKSQEVDSMMHHWGISRGEAIQLAGIDARRYRTSAAPVIYLPSPAEIERKRLLIRSGELNFNRPDNHLFIVDSDDENRRRFEEAGTLPEDKCPTPAWLYSADQVIAAMGDGKSVSTRRSER